MNEKSCAPTCKVEDWASIDWNKARAYVKKLQMRIVKAQQEGHYSKVKTLQWLLTHSFYAKALAVKRVTSNRGKNTAGVDHEHQAVLRAELSYPVSLGDDARGNITRLDNAIDNFADRIADAENALQNLEQQKQAAEIEVAKPFAQEEELAEKSARLAELNALLNIDRDRSSSQDTPEESEGTEAPATRPSVLAALEEKANQPEPVKPFKGYLDKEGR